MTRRPTSGHHPRSFQGVVFDTSVWINAALARAALAADHVPPQRYARDLRITAQAIDHPALVVHSCAWQLRGIADVLTSDYGMSAEAARAEVADVSSRIAASGGQVVGRIADTDLLRPVDVSVDDATILTTAVLTGSSFLVTEDAQFLQAASVATLREGDAYAFPTTRPDQTLAGVHPHYFEAVAMRRAGWTVHPQEQQTMPPAGRVSDTHALAATTDVGGRAAALRAARLALETAVAGEVPMPAPTDSGDPAPIRDHALPPDSPRRRLRLEAPPPTREPPARGPSMGS